MLVLFCRLFANDSLCWHTKLLVGLQQNPFLITNIPTVRNICKIHFVVTFSSRRDFCFFVLRFTFFPFLLSLLQTGFLFFRGMPNTTKKNVQLKKIFSDFFETAWTNGQTNMNGYVTVLICCFWSNITLYCVQILPEKPVKLWSKSKKNQGKNRKLFYFFQTRFSRNDEKGVIHGFLPTTFIY